MQATSWEFSSHYQCWITAYAARCPHCKSKIQIEIVCHLGTCCPSLLLWGCGEQTSWKVEGFCNGQSTSCVLGVARVEFQGSPVEPEAADIVSYGVAAPDLGSYGFDSAIFSRSAIRIFRRLFNHSISSI